SDLAGNASAESIASQGGSACGNRRRSRSCDAEGGLHGDVNKGWCRSGAALLGEQCRQGSRRQADVATLQTLPEQIAAALQTTLERAGWYAELVGRLDGAQPLQITGDECGAADRG